MPAGASGTILPDLINGTKGADTITGLTGNDRIFSGAGDDVVDAGAGNDFVDAGTGNDNVVAGAGNDTVFAGAGDDLVDGGIGNDRISAGSGNDIVYGGEGNDDINGDAGDDTLYGGEGNDLIRGDAGNDVLTGGSGNDRFWFWLDNSAKNINLNQRLGSDVITDFKVRTKTSAENDSLDLSSLWARFDDQVRKDVLAAMNKAVATSVGTELADQGQIKLGLSDLGGTKYTFNVQYVGGNLVLGMTDSQGSGLSSVTLQGIAKGTVFTDSNLTADGRKVWHGDNPIAEHGPAVVRADNITFVASAGTSDANTIYLGSKKGVEAFGFGGDDTLTGTDQADVLRGGTGDDSLSGAGGNDWLEGDNGNDVLNGDGGNDRLHGGNGNDVLNGGEGNDILVGNAGDDMLTGGMGADQFVIGGRIEGTRLVLDVGLKTITDFELGTDKLALADNIRDVLLSQAISDDNDIALGWNRDEEIATVTVNGVDLLKFLGVDSTDARDALRKYVEGVFSTSIEMIGDPSSPFSVKGTGAGNTMTGTMADEWFYGFGGNDIINGGAGNDGLSGGSGNDSLIGGLGNDGLLGGGGNDTLIGGEGNDALSGGRGNDALTGGTGADSFSFDARFGTDRITDFAAGEDMLQFASGLLGGATIDELRSDVEAALASGVTQTAGQVTVSYNIASQQLLLSFEEGALDSTLTVSGVASTAGSAWLQVF